MRKHYINMSEVPISYSIDLTKDNGLLELEILKRNYLKGTEYFDVEFGTTEKIIDLIIVPARRGDFTMFMQALDCGKSYFESLDVVTNWQNDCESDLICEYSIVCVLEKKCEQFYGYGKNIFRNLGYVLACVELQNLNTVN